MTEPTLSCPSPARDDGERITLAHGEGGRRMRRLLQERILPTLGITVGDSADAASLGNVGQSLAMTTDGYVVSPLFFPGGDIGKLAVFGTANDLAVSGAAVRWLSLGLIIEEGLAWSLLEAVLKSIAEAARLVGAPIVTGDTKVVPRGAADQLFLTTTGVGELFPVVPPGPTALRPGDVLIASGPIGCHGVAVMAARERMGFLPPPTSDCASLLPAVAAMFAKPIVPRAIRDATRGGTAAVLHEWAELSGLAMRVDESQLPITPEVAGVCELLGLDPLHVAGEGMMLLAVSPEQADAALEALRGTEVARFAQPIGEVIPRRLSPVLVRRGLGRELPLDEPLGAPLPRIC
ncbi:MAG: hydrogenase expression/formation protein HypE [Planctomycetaceae bacterium]|nr:MAG: hydrogenase expression/formation protein HypE [Planctomycetaceae bacterium]